MTQIYQEAAANSRKRRNQPLFEYPMPLTEEEWKRLLEWVERNYSSRVSQPLKEKTS